MKSSPIILFILLASTCKSIPNKNPIDYKLINEKGIFVEKFNAENVNENRFNQNNIIYKVGNTFKYSYEYISTDEELSLSPTPTSPFETSSATLSTNDFQSLSDTRS